MLTCKEYATLRKQELKEYIEEKGLKPCLVVIQVGDRPESNSYIRGKMRDCEEVGIECNVVKYEEHVTQKQLEAYILECDIRKHIHGIIVQLPVPDHIDIERIQNLISYNKDVDGFSKISKFDPCTPKGVIDYLKYIGYEFEGKDALVIGRSDIVGKPLARMLTDLNCTVTLAHSRTEHIEDHMYDADIIFTCINEIDYFLINTAHYPGPNTDIIDIGLGIGLDGKLHGNLHHKELRAYINDNPNNIVISGTGGVGLLTRLALLENVVKAAEEYHG